MILCGQHQVSIYSKALKQKEMTRVRIPPSPPAHTQVLPKFFDPKELPHNQWLACHSGKPATMFRGDTAEPPGSTARRFPLCRRARDTNQACASPRTIPSISAMTAPGCRLSWQHQMERARSRIRPFMPCRLAHPLSSDDRRGGRCAPVTQA